MYASLYSAERFFVEGLRTDSLMIGPFRQAQIFSLAVIALCIVVYYVMRRHASHIAAGSRDAASEIREKENQK